ncbi:MAG TPA: aminotransferase class IV [Candidatus Woesebacteria bacterium]|nr:aminotransferase class IV [Candidatus Woesebacteria bacterium]
MKDICSINGKIVELTKATISLKQIEYQYGFGVYETIKVRNTLVYFLDQHIDRLFHSAKLISLQHNLQQNQVKTYISTFINTVEQSSLNLKVLLYGGNKSEETKLVILASAPLFPNRKWYKEGVSLMTYQYKRWMPQAKTLHMVASYYIYKQAQQRNCYDALLYDYKKNILEGTRTNIFMVKGNTIISPLKKNILEGVTLLSLEKVIKNSRFTLNYQNIPLKTLSEYDGMFVTSTSSKIMPVKQVDHTIFPKIPQTIIDLIKLYDNRLEKSKGEFNLL